MDRTEWGGCIAAGSTVLLVGAILKCIPTKETNKLNTVMKKGVDEDKEETNAIVQRYKNANQPQEIDHNKLINSAKNKMNEVNKKKMGGHPNAKKGDTDDINDPYDDDDFP